MQNPRKSPSSGLMARLRAVEPFAPWQTETALLFTLLVVVLWIATLSIVSTATGEINTSSPSTRALALSGLGSGLVTIIGVVQWARRAAWANGPKGQYWRDALRLSRTFSRNTILLIFLMCLGLAFAIDLLGILLKLKEGQIVPVVLGPLCRPDSVIPVAGLTATACQPEPVSFVIALVLALVIQPIAEGLVFFAILTPSMNRVFPGDSRIGALVVALIYMGVSLVLSASPGAWYSLIQPFFMTLIVGLVRAYYQSARAAIIARIGFGAFFVVAALLSSGFVNAPVPR